MSSLLADLQALEVELHHPGVACDAVRLEELLHTDFHEVGRSGRRYDRATVLRFLSERELPPQVRSDDFVVTRLGHEVAMLTYRSAQRRPDGVLEQHAYRVSIWARAGGRWQLLYHQGTPTTPFD